MGTGKTLAYLVPAILSGHHPIVATATKALQDQLAGREGVEGQPEYSASVTCSPQSAVAFGDGEVGHEVVGARRRASAIRRRG